MKVYIDGKEVECNRRVQILIPVQPRDGVTEKSQLQYHITDDLLETYLLEVMNDRFGTEPEDVYSIAEEHEEVADRVVKEGY